jgi:hypothetical protein
VDVQALARRVDDDLAAALERLRAAQDKVVEAQQQLDELQALRDSFALAVERYGETATGAKAAAGARRGRGQRAPRRRVGRSARPRRSTAGAPAQAARTPSPDGEPSLADATLAALVSFGRSATTNEVRDKLAESGRPVPVEHIRSSLGYLERRAGKIKRVGRALWEPQGQAAAS